jgi:hypothetical protein
MTEKNAQRFHGSGARLWKGPRESMTSELATYLLVTNRMGTY